MSEDELPAVELDVVDGVEHLIEKMDELHRMRGRADAVVQSGHVGYVAIILLVEMDTIPAALELNLRSQAVTAIRHVHMRAFFRRRCS